MKSLVIPIERPNIYGIPVVFHMFYHIYTYSSSLSYILSLGTFEFLNIKSIVFITFERRYMDTFILDIARSKLVALFHERMNSKFTDRYLLIIMSCLNIIMQIYD